MRRTTPFEMQPSPPVGYARPMFELLFLGNSYTFQNELDVVTADVLTAGVHPEATATRLAEGGYTWSLHRDQCETADSAWDEALVDPGHPWGWVILQEQSQIPGFPHTEPDWTESADAGAALNAYAAALGSETVLLMTWGRRLGDETNPSLYPDFLTMQDALTDGYLTYRDRFATEARPVWVAPAGLAFQAVYEAVAADGLTPEDDGTLFSILYQEDGSHPAPAGTWLTAWVIYATLTGESPIGLPLPSQIPAEDATRLQEIADEVVLGNAAGLVYPWSTDTGATDTGATDTDDPGTTDTDDTGTTDTSGTPGADSGTPKADATACGCASGAGSAGWTAAWLGFAALARRRRARG